MSLLSPYYPSDSQYADDFPYSGDAPGSCVERGPRNEYVDYRTAGEKAEDARFWATIRAIQEDRRAA
jgi:hypothetical protein